MKLIVTAKYKGKKRDKEKLRRYWSVVEPSEYAKKMVAKDTMVEPFKRCLT